MAVRPNLSLIASTERSTPHLEASTTDPGRGLASRPILGESRGSSSWKEWSGRKLETETARRVISRSRSLSRMAEWASLSATSVSVSVVEIATGNVIDRVTERS